MENKRSFLNSTYINIVPNLSIRIPTVGEILEDEDNYYSIVSSLTASPFQYMVQLDDMAIDYTNGWMDFARKCFTNGGGSGIVVFSDKQS